MVQLRIHLIDDVGKEILYIMEDEKKRSIRNLALETLKKKDVGYSTIIRRVEALVEDGYLSERRIYNVREITITELGREMIKCLRCADEILKKYGKL